VTATLEATLLTGLRREGRPRTKGSLNVYCCKDKRHTVRVEEETKDSKLWRRQMAVAAQQAMKKHHGRLVNYAGPVEVKVTFIFARTIGVGGEVWPSHATPFPTDRNLGDLDKLMRNLGDALQDAHVLADDSFIVTTWSHKRWARDGEAPGLIAEVWTVPHE
jgi:Holliday junction resolvase RusA-like endonuclease